MYEIIICDRDSAFINYMKAMLLRAGIKAEDAHFHGYDSGKELVRALETQERVDLLILDMQMKHYKDEDRIVSREKLKDLYETLMEHDFIHAHNSYIVNLKHVKRINKSELELSDGTVLSIARSKEKECRERAAQWFSRKRD